MAVLGRYGIVGLLAELCQEQCPWPVPCWRTESLGLGPKHSEAGGSGKEKSASERDPREVKTGSVTKPALDCRKARIRAYLVSLVSILSTVVR